MSYYFNNPYNFSFHGLSRIKSRLKLQHLSDTELKSYCLKLINESSDVIETKSFKYVKVNKTFLYFVIKKENNLVLTISPINPAKLLTIIEENL